MNYLRLHLLGAPLVEQGAEAVHFGRRKTLALLAYLAVTERSQRRDALAAFLWPDLDRRRGLASLRRCLADLSKIFSDHLRADRTTIELRPAEDLWIDVLEFLGASGQCLDEPEKNRLAPGGDLARLEAAAGLYRDEFLAGFSLPDSEAFDDWQFGQSERFRREQSRILEALVETHRSEGRLDPAIEYAQQWLLLDRLAEDVHRLLIRLYLEAGERSEALRQYERCAEILRDELDVEPEAATRALLKEIRSGESVPLETSRTQAQPPARIMILPETQTSILGREKELAELTARLTDPACRLLTLVGPGGIGKTRLALETAHQLEDRFRDGVCFVGLAAASPETMLATITDQLGLSLDPKGEPETQLFTFLGDRQVLLVLDNFEHLADEAGVVSRLLSHTHRVRVLATSRERLNLHGEWVFEVHGLEIPGPHQDLQQLAQIGSVQLFLEAARRVEPEFQLTSDVKPAVAEICRMLAGMPLGLELAAAWLRVIPCSEIAREVQGNIDFLASKWRDLPERHRSLRAVFESSLQLLKPAERKLLMVLSVFRGGFSREAAGEVTGASLSELAGLLDKSLVTRSSDGRYQLHELIRQFAEELLRKEGETWRKIRVRHGEYYLNLLVNRSGSFASAKLKDIMAELYSEADNLRGAWATVVEQRRLDLLEAGLDPCHQFHQLANRFAEGERKMGAAADILSPKKQPLLWARAAARQGRFNNRLGRYKKAHRQLEDSLRIFVKLKVPEEIALTQTALSVVFFHLGDFQQSKSLASRGVSLWRELGEPHGLANALVQYGRTKGYSGEIEDAKTILHEAYELFEGFQDIYGMARCLNNLANLTYLSGEQEEAIRLFELSKRSFDELGDRRGSAFSISNMAVVMEDLGKHAEAKQMSRQALALFRAIGYQEADSRTRGPAIPLENCGRACLGLGEYEEARECFLAALETAVKIQQTPLILASLLGLASWMIHEGQVDRAWEIVELATDHPRLSLEGSNQLADLRGRLEALPGVARAPKSRQPASIRLRLLINELLEPNDDRRSPAEDLELRGS